MTGGSGDIGAAVCRRLSAAGFAIIVHANRGVDKANALAEELQRGGGTAKAVSFDVTDEDATGDALERVLHEGGPVQVLVNNAGVHSDAPMAGMTHRQWNDVIDVSLNGFFNVTRPLLMPMVGCRWGRIINVSSVSGVLGTRGQANYAAAKAGLHGATRSLARELATRGVTVNAVAPGIIAGHLTDAAFDAAQVKALVPMQRKGSPEEVAALVRFLASDESGYISGQVIGINGGMI